MIVFSLMGLVLLEASSSVALEHETQIDGLEVLVATLPKQDFCSAELVVRVGADSDPVGKAGLAHLVEHLAFGQFGLKMADSMHSQVNAMTSATETVFTMKAESEFCAKELGRFLSLVTAGEFRNSWFDTQLMIVDREQLYFNTGSARWVEAGLFGELSAAILGTRASRSAIEFQDATQFYSEFYKPHNMALVVAGDIRLDDVKKAIDLGMRLPPLTPPAERTGLTPKAIAFSHDRELQSIRPGTAVAAVVMQPSETELCQQSAAVVKLQLIASLKPFYQNTVVSQCMHLHGQMALAFGVVGAPADDARLRGLVRSVCEQRTNLTTEMVTRAQANFHRDSSSEKNSLLVVGELRNLVRWATGPELHRGVTERAAKEISPEQFRVFFKRFKENCMLMTSSARK
jgi:Insulinase (Peptidase family M16)/Peptidase M16 inactive domain